ncbi:MAG: hypothetical protein RLZZ126_1239 [Pseudomonadota bacterium]|jgi:SAM-dependent methyltransferase
MHDTTPPSDWLRRWSHLLPAGGEVLDLACGGGRHMAWLKALGHPVLGVDRDPAALALASAHGQTLLADIENGPWPLMEAAGSGQAPRRFAGVVITNYLWRPLLPIVAESLALGGVLIYETFASGNETVGKPSRPDFLLRPGELAEAFRQLRIVAFEDGFLPQPERFVQRIVAVNEGPVRPRPARYGLTTPG